MIAPTSESFWIVPGQLLAGKYPGALDQDEAARKVAAICQAGVTAFVDLTEDGELLPYAQLLPPGVRHHRRPIADLSCAPAGQVEATLDLIDAELGRGCVYVHCWGGCGRTGTIVGCWLIRHGATADDALGLFAEASTPIALRPCPEMPEQVLLVRSWQHHFSDSRGTTRGTAL